jgi:hypothetical protein
MSRGAKRVTVTFLASRVIELEAELRKMRRRCRRCREDRAPAIGFRLGDDASTEQDPDDEEDVDTTLVAGNGARRGVRGPGRLTG